MRLQLLGGAEQVLEGFAQHGRAHHPAARVVAPGYLPQRVGGGKRKRHAGGGTAHAAQGFARCLAQEATEQLAAKLLQVLRGQAHPGGGDEFLDVALVQLYAVGLANAIHHLHLQRNDGHRRPRLRQQLQCAVEQGVVEDGFVQVRIRCARGGGSGRGTRCCYCRQGGRDGFFCHIHQRIGFLVKRRSLLGIELQRRFERGQKVALGRRLAAVHIAHAHRHFVGQLALHGVTQGAGRRLHTGALQQHVLVDARQVGHARVASQRLGQAADFLALGVVLAAVGKCGQKGNGKNGFLLVQVHGGRSRAALKMVRGG